MLLDIVLCNHGGLCPDALRATQAAEMGQIPILDAFFCIESGEDVRQMAMHGPLTLTPDEPTIS